MPKPFFITTAIDYTNGAPHIGHAYEKILADVIARYHRLKGDEVFFLTGVDQHGQKVQQSAEKAGVSPQQFVDEITKKFVALWDKLDVRYDAWAATTDPLHKECVRANLQKLWDDKDPATGESKWLYKKTERGWYSVRQEQFLTDKERGADGEFGPEWQPVEEREEENFYFRLKEHKQWLLDFIDKRSAEKKPFVVPDFRVSELRNAVEKLDGDLCISRPASRLKWGIPFPETFGAGFVTYVWFDALVNYISFVPGHDPNWKDEGGRMKDEKKDSSLIPHPSSFSHWWPPLHVIGKDIMIPAHGVYWPIMLKALGFADDEMPTLLVHGWWNIAGAKMSKSTGNSVDPDALADKYGAEALRYYLMSDIATGKDADFSEERLVQRYNVDLANSLGNLLNRSLNMAQKYREGKIKNITPEPERVLLANNEEQILSYNDEFERNGKKRNLPRFRDEISGDADLSYKSMMSEFRIDLALFAISTISNRANELVEVSAPWELAKDISSPIKAQQLDAVIYHLAESLRIIAILISPVLPKAAAGIFAQLNWNGPMTLTEAVWGKLPDGHVVGKPVPLFPRIELPAA
jgi:methionyl-tRNA synthetase